MAFRGFGTTAEPLCIRSDFITGSAVLPVRFRPDHFGMKEID